MKKTPLFIVLSTLFCPLVYSADHVSTKDAASNEQKAPTKKFEAFTAEVIKNKVRLRIQPSYDSPVVRELKHHDLVVVTGESEDFYSVRPPTDLRAYVFRTYILDNVVEGTRVNVRLKPDVDAPIVTQLNAGDHVEGTISPAHPKWLEISLPETTRFYVAKDYVNKIGDAELLNRLEKRRSETQKLLITADAIHQLELQKPFEQIDADKVKRGYAKVYEDYRDIPEAAAKAQEQLALFQEAYTAKKLAHLESQQHVAPALAAKNQQLMRELEAQKAKVVSLEQKVIPAEAPINNPVISHSSVPKTPATPTNMTVWMPLEMALFQAWAKESGQSNPEQFYREQRESACVVRGVVDVYNRPVKNKPGDYLLVSGHNRLPIAFLYSTKVNLQDYVGHEVRLIVAPRPNNNYAFPAYFVLGLE